MAIITKEPRRTSGPGLVVRSQTGKLQSGGPQQAKPVGSDLS